MKSGRAILLCVFAFHFAFQNGYSKPPTEREGWAITCAKGTIEKIAMRSTERLPEASGAVRVERRGGTTVVDVELEAMKPASLFGGDYNTYVLWVVPPGGPAENLGELPLDGSRAKLHASTAETTFAILVSAEPHYLTLIPSVFVVLENQPGPQAQPVRYPVLQGDYNFYRSTLDDSKPAKGKVHSELQQAFTALRLAQRAGAPVLAANQFTQAQRALEEAVKLGRQSGDRTPMAAQARETVRLAVAAQRLASDRAFQGTRVEGEGSGGGKGETERRDQRGSR